MSKLNFTIKLPSFFKNFEGISAIALNRKGLELDSVRVKRRQFRFKVDKDDSLLGKNSGKITIKTIDDNGEEINFRKDGLEFDMNPDAQKIPIKISSKKSKYKKEIRLKGAKIVGSEKNDSRPNEEEPSKEIETQYPIFTQAKPTTLDENTGAGAVIFQAEAVDPGGFAVTYQITGPDKDAFNINPQTGEITIKENADFEAKQIYNFSVVAMNSKGEDTSKDFVLEINDVDDEAPLFNDEFPKDLDENVGDDFVVFQAQATDNSGEPISYGLEGEDASDFAIDSTTGSVTLLKSPDYETKNLYRFNVTATDSSGNTSSKLFALNIRDVFDTGNRELRLARAGADTMTEDSWEIAKYMSADFEKFDIGLTQFDDLITAYFEDLGVDDLIVDPSRLDNDTLYLYTGTSSASIDHYGVSKALNGIKGIANIETLVIDADDDRSGTISLRNIVNLENLVVKGDIDGGKTDRVFVFNYPNTANVSSFDFSEAEIPRGVQIVNIDENHRSPNKPLTIYGSSESDKFVGGLRSIKVFAGNGRDEIVGSISGSDYIAGEGGIDTIDISGEAIPRMDTISLNGITSFYDSSVIKGFLGFNNPLNKGNQHDVLEFDALTFNNYTAKTKVEQASVNNILGRFPVDGDEVIKNKFIVDTISNIITSNLSFGDNLLAVSSDTGWVIYSKSGNFQLDGIRIGDITDPQNFVAEQNVVIV